MKIFDFINHASIKIEYNNYTIVTDPWYISNAFGSWYQNPPPFYNDVFDLVDNDNLGVIISHGHDDHLDDWFIGHHLNKNHFFCPKFASPGLENRLKELTSNLDLIENGAVFGDFKIKQFINPYFTGYDAIVTIKTDDYLIIHANDNYHEWPDSVATEIKNECRGVNKDNIFLLIQFGIADCYPVNYIDVSNEEAFSIINSRFKNYANATKKNMKILGLDHMYYYANQSFFDYKVHKLNDQSTYSLALDFLKQNKLPSTQLIPGMTIHSKHSVFMKDIKQDIFTYCLKSFENFINDNYKKKCTHYLNVRFKVNGDMIEQSDINYFAQQDVWRRIMIGELTLESIIIGGAGSIFKPIDDISEHFFFVMKLGYLAQKEIKKTGILFFRKYSYEK